MILIVAIMFKGQPLLKRSTNVKMICFYAFPLQLVQNITFSFRNPTYRWPLESRDIERQLSNNTADP